MIDDLSSAIAALSLLAGGFFFFAGTAGLVRFPDLLTRLHALTKADNLGLGFVVLGLAIQSEVSVIAELGIIWGLVLVSSSTCAQLIASHVLRSPSSSGSTR
jgi:multicomponent Na+:H+ antiporter subunit G